MNWYMTGVINYQKEPGDPATSYSIKHKDGTWIVVRLGRTPVQPGQHPFSNTPGIKQ